MKCSGFSLRLGVDSLSRKIHPSLRLVAASLVCSLARAGPVGFASLDSSTTGGGEAPSIIVRSALELQRELEQLDIPDKKLRDGTPRTIRLAGDIDFAELANSNPGRELKRTCIVFPRSNTTLECPSGGATLRRGMIELKGAKNVIIRNLRFRDFWELDSSGQYDDYG